MVCLDLYALHSLGFVTILFLKKTLGTFHIFLSLKHFILVRYKFTYLQIYCGDHDQTPLTAASALGLHFAYVIKSDYADIGLEQIEFSASKLWRP